MIPSLGFTEEEIRQSLTTNAAFSTSTLALQTSWDSTSLGAFKFCPRRYFYEIIMGFIPRRKNVDLMFGILVHGGVELYHRLCGSTGHDEALREVVKWAQTETWDRAKARPEVWDDPVKNRTSLLRLLVWYLDRWKDDPLETLSYGDGRPMVEVNFAISLPYKSSRDEPFNLCGYFDRLVKFQGDYYVSDIKTTRHQLDRKHFESFTPNNQFSIYTIAARVALEKPANGVIVDGCQVGATFARFQREFIPRSEEQLEEWVEDQRGWLEDAEREASRLHWRMNDRLCWNCPFRPTCSRPPQARRAWLEANFVRRVWDPTKKRGDI